MTTLARSHGLLIVALITAACGGGSSAPTDTTPGGATTARITIEQQTATSTIYAGTVWHRNGKTVGAVTSFTPQSDKCSASPVPHTCYFDVPIGDSVMLAAQDQLAEPSIGNWSTTTSAEDPRTIQSQFVNWGAGCTQVQRGYCVLKAAGNVTITASYKPLSLTKFYFSGLNSWGITVTTPAPVLDPAGISAPNPVRTVRVYGSGIFTSDNAPQHPRCIGESPGVRCAYVMAADNASIKFEAFNPGAPTPMGSPGPLKFVGWSGGGCSSAPTAAGEGSCTVPGGVDQTITVKWQYYRCFAANGASFASEGTGGWMLAPPLGNCVLTQ